MKPKILLRIASAVVIFHDMGHTLGAVTWRQSPDPIKQMIINQCYIKIWKMCGF